MRAAGANRRRYSACSVGNRYSSTNRSRAGRLVPIRPVSIRETLDADQPSSRATSRPAICAPTLASRNSRASRRSRTDGESGWFIAEPTPEPPEPAETDEAIARCPAILQPCFHSRHRNVILRIRGHGRSEKTTPATQKGDAMTSHHSFLFVDQWPVMVVGGTPQNLRSKGRELSPDPLI